jgi:2-polyprenyl-6-methoxyphenol hydroxylase-like FAD-dependent oxidoreductase
MPSTIAIAGGGLSGLVLARILQLHDIPCTVYEADPSADARSQGGSLDMHVESGQLALRAAGLYDEFRRHTHPQGEAMRVLDKAGVVYIDEPSKEGDGDRPEIDRTVLRNLLIESLDPGRIAWGHKVTAVRTRDDGRHELTFANGASVAADLLVGADGTWSKVRPLLSAAKPEYTGISYLELHITDAKSRHPDSAEIVGTGILFALSDNKAIMGHGGSHIHLGASLRAPENWLASSGVNWSDPAEAKAALQAEFADWSTDLTDLIRNSDDTIVPRLIHALPTDHSWTRVPGVTLIGDAAHVMSPFAGEGANLAMLDATELAMAIIESGADTESPLTQQENELSQPKKPLSQNGNGETAPARFEVALARYETAMFPRARAAAEGSAQGLAMCFAADSPSGLVKFFSGMAEI